MRSPLYRWFALVLAVAVPAAAEEPPPPASFVTDPVFVTATKLDTPQSRLGASTTIVTAEDIQTFNYAGVEDALRPVPGVEIQRAGGLGKATAIRIRGAGPQQVQVLVDGMRVKSPTLGSVDLAEFSLDAVDRIEIVRGPQSTFHGADAIGGVVNIITKKGQGKPSGFLHLEGGSYDTFRERVGVQGAVGGFNFNLAGTRYDTAGRFDNDDAEQTSFAGRIGYDFPWKGELSLTGRYSRTSVDLPFHSTIPPPTIFDPNSQIQLETGLATAAYAQPVTSWWDLHVRYGYWSNRSAFQDSAPPPPPPFPIAFPDEPAIDSVIATRRHEVEMIHAFKPVSWTTLSLGGEFRSERADVVDRVPDTGFTSGIETFAVFVQDELRFFDRLFITASVRWEDSDVFESAVTSRVAVSYLLKETGTKLRGVWGEGFRAPTINDLFFPNFGNPTLQPERSESWEVGVDQRLWKNRVRFGLTYFHNDFEDLIQFVFTPPSTFRPENVGRATTRGFEAYLEVEPLEWLMLYANYTNLSTRDAATGLALPRFPKHHVNTGVVVTPKPWVSVFAQATAVSSQFESPGIASNPAYHRIDVGGRVRLLGRVGVMEKLELTVRVENLTNASYAQVFGFPAPGVTVLAGLRAQFQ